MILTTIFGIIMIVLNPDLLQAGWMHIKLTLGVLLIGYHHYTTGLLKKLKKNTMTMSSMKLRTFNEIPTLFLFSMIFLAILKNIPDLIWVMAFVVGPPLWRFPRRVTMS